MLSEVGESSGLSNFTLTSFDFFFFNDTATTEIYTLSLHDALPISKIQRECGHPGRSQTLSARVAGSILRSEEHTSELSHGYISYAVFCLKKKKKSDARPTPSRQSRHLRVQPVTQAQMSIRAVTFSR